VAKAVTLDGLANMLAGSVEPLGQILTRFVSSMGGVPAATVIGTAVKTNPALAAFANAAFCHSMDYEAMWWPPTHPTSPVLPALIALAEQEGSSGKRVLEALVVGFEVQGRLNLCADWIRDPYAYFHPPGTIGAIGSAAACAKLLGLDVWTTRMAIGIAASRTGGLWANTGTMTKSQHSANAARSGVEAALLARAGYTSNENILETKKGGFGQLILGEEADLAKAVENFGSPYRLLSPGITLKRYPAQTTTHWCVDAALALRGRYGLKPAEIEKVLARVGYPNWSAHWPRPRNGLEGKFSIHYTVALALLDGKLTIDSFTDKRRFAPDVDAMLGRISVEEDKDIPSGLNFAETWATLTITSRAGKVVTARCDRPRGRWDNPLTRKERHAKFTDCAARVLEPTPIAEIIRLTERLDELDNLSHLTARLRATVK
jgi:aconitate decarboxylase